MLALAGWCALAVPAYAGGGNDEAIRALSRLKEVAAVDVIDVAGESDPNIFAKRGIPDCMPLTPLQTAIVNNRAVVAAIDDGFLTYFDLKSVYAAKVVGDRVYIYLGDPPCS